jgi:hypothetical protein
MDIHTLWIVILSITTPIAGVIGFAIQLRQLKKAQLENEKLQLELIALKERAAKVEQRVIKPTNKEVLKVNHGQTMFSRGSALKSLGNYTNRTSKLLSTKTPKELLRGKIFAAITLSSVVLIVTYLLYDIYRVALWVISKL